MAGQEPGQVEALLWRARALARDNPRAALALAEEAVQRADRDGAAELQAEARLVLGHAHRFAGQHELALADYAAAEQRFRRLRRPVDAARTATGTIYSLGVLGRTGEALRRAEWARRTFRRHHAPVPAAALEMNLGILHYRLDAYRPALRLFDRARPVLALAGRWEDVASLDINAANALVELDRLHEADALYRRSRTFYAERQARATVATIDLNLGYLAYRHGRYGVAVDTLQRAAATFDALEHRPLAVATRLDLVETYLALDLREEAAELAAEQVRRARTAGLVHERGRAACYVAALEGQSGRISAALAGTKRAEAAFAREANVVWQTRCRVGRAALLLARGARGDPAKALKLARSAAAVFKRLALPARHASALLVEARALLAQGDGAGAERVVRAALALANEVAAPWPLFDCQYILGRARLAQSDAGAAYAAFAAAADQLDRSRVRLRPAELRVTLPGDRNDLYQQLVLLCLRRAAGGEAGAHEQALDYAERAKARTLLAPVPRPIELEPDPGVVGDADARTLARMRRLREELNALYSRPADDESSAALARARAARARAAPPARDAAAWRRQAARDERELGRLHHRLRPASRAQAALLGVADPPADARPPLRELRGQLPPGRVVFEYFQAGPEMVLFVLGGDGLAAHRLGPATLAADLVERFEFQVRKFALGADYVARHLPDLIAATTDVLRQLYDLLVQPAAAHLDGASGVSIIPHGPLHYLPFHALLDQQARPLIERVELAYAPSARVLATCLAQPTTRHSLDRVLLMGTSDANIPEVAAELSALRQLFGPRLIFSGEAATEAAFRRHAPEADVIHLASHAVFRKDNPLFSSLRLADGWLALYDLYDLRLRASLVTLSGCETGVSEVSAGDELVGLSHGFFQAGAASLVVSLWAVNDEATARLMEQFYRHLRAGEGPATAMRAAQRALLQVYRHPYYWAPFLVIGRP